MISFKEYVTEAKSKKLDMAKLEKHYLKLQDKHNSDKIYYIDLVDVKTNIYHVVQIVKGNVTGNEENANDITVKNIIDSSKVIGNKQYLKVIVDNFGN